VRWRDLGTPGRSRSPSDRSTRTRGHDAHGERTRGLLSLARFEGRFVSARPAYVQSGTLDELAERGLVDARTTETPYGGLVARLTPAGVEAAFGLFP
jgi:hypothetical protein